MVACSSTDFNLTNHPLACVCRTDFERIFTIKMDFCYNLKSEFLIEADKNRQQAKKGGGYGAENFYAWAVQTPGERYTS
jgi:hypothetical protein